MPAAVRYARLLVGAGKRRKAVAIVEETWVSNPHPLLVEVTEELGSSSGAEEKVRVLERLAGYNRDHIESHIAIARAAMEAGRWSDAREHLEACGDDPPARVCRYMAELEEAENGDVEASREWLHRASVADPDSAWVCENCGHAVADWVITCERCESFDSLEWRTPPRVTRMSEADSPFRQSAGNSAHNTTADVDANDNATNTDTDTDTDTDNDHDGGNGSGPEQTDTNDAPTIDGDEPPETMDADPEAELEDDPPETMDADPEAELEDDPPVKPI